MTNYQAPEIGAWYINLNNQFLRVWALVFEHGQVDKVVVHYLNGLRFVIDLEAWDAMDLERYPTHNEKRSGATQA